MNCPPSRTSRKRASSSGIRGSYWEWTSTSGIVTASHFSGAEPPVDEIRRENENACHDGVLHVLERVVEALEARAQRVADAAEGKGPDRRADGHRENEPRERELEDAGGDGDERADERCE